MYVWMSMQIPRSGNFLYAVLDQVYLVFLCYNWWVVGSGLVATDCKLCFPLSNSISDNLTSKSSASVCGKNSLDFVFKLQLQIPWSQKVTRSYTSVKPQAIYFQTLREQTSTRSYVKITQHVLVCGKHPWLLSPDLLALQQPYLT